MRTSLAVLLLISLCAALAADPRGLTSREIIIEDALAGVQPQAPLLPFAPETCESTVPARDTWVPVLEQSLDIMLPAGDQYGLRFSTQLADAEPFSSLGELLPESVAAVDRAPEWIRLELQKTLHQLEPDRQLAFAGLINSASDPYVDEIAFCVATSFPEYLNSSFALPELFTENAEWIYSIADELPYVEVIDTGSAATGGSYHSTTRYWKKDDGGNLVQMDVPRDIYYWYLVHPKITDEIAAYIDPDIIENNSTHSNNIVPPPEGKFWRSYLYDFEEDGYPVLSDTLTQCQTVFNRDGSPGAAARAIIWWINQNMSFTSNAERPHQPVRIFAKRIGRCGEYADLTSAVARTALIPCTNIASISTDHTWNEFWEDGWVSWEPVNGYLNNPLVYENGWGKVFGSVFEERCDGLFTPVTDRYSEGLATINIQVVDEDLNPVDAARVVLAIFENSIRFDCEQYTDNQGIATFEVGENRDYRGRAETFFGLYPANPGTYVQLTDNTADGETYNYQFQIAAPMPLPSIDALSPPNDPEQDHRFCVSFESSGYYVTGRTLYDDIDVLGFPANYYKASDTPADAAFLVTDADNILFYQIDNFCSAYSYQSPAATGSATFDIPVGQDWYAFVDNSHRHGNATRLSGLIVYENWGTSVDDPQIPPAVFSLSRPAPNPMWQKTEMRLDLAKADEIRIEIYNVRGQKVRSFRPGMLSAGIHNLSWDGRDDTGLEVSSGLYFIRVQNEVQMATRRVLVIK
jgi:hypothetical protein